MDGTSGGMNDAIDYSEQISLLAERLKAETFTSHPEVDKALHELFLVFAQQFVLQWYTSLSDDQEFLGELIGILKHVCRVLEYEIFPRISFIRLFAQDLPQLLHTHVRDYQLCKEKYGTIFAGGRSMEELFHGIQPHVALEDAESELAYLRQAVEMIMRKLLPPEEMKSDLFRILLKETLVHVVLAPIMTKMAKREEILDLILVGLSPSTNEFGMVEGSVEDSRINDTVDASTSAVQSQQSSRSRLNQAWSKPEFDFLTSPGRWSSQSVAQGRKSLMKISHSLRAKSRAVEDNEDVHLEEAWLDLLLTISPAPLRKRFLYIQYHFFIKPILQFLGGSIVNRKIANIIHALTGPKNVAFLVTLLVDVISPDKPKPGGDFDGPADIFSKELQITRAMPRHIKWLFSENEIEHSMMELFDMLDNQYINKHLLFALLDLVLSHIIPNDKAPAI
ncbi:PXA domain-containing protein [Phlyctochytrium arcticum]|nr:PXA domain-containing protein [Phlyctochytrium arcticum]